MAATRRTLGHQPALDGLRALAVVAVLLYHLGQANAISWLQSATKGGFLGVSAFLTLSGFLITTLLLLEYESVGHVSLGGFWGRRFRRLMPAALLTLAAVTLLTPLVGTQAQLGDLPGEVWAALGYVVNWKFVVSGSDYAAVFNGAPSPIKHFWSLAVEEQCYFVLPFVVAVCMRFGRRRRLVGAAFVTLILGSFTMLLVLGGGEYSNRVYMGTDTRIAELAVGALLAVLVAGRHELRSTPGFLASSVAGPLALGMVLAAWTTTDIRAPWLYRGGLALHAVAVAVVILAAMQPHSALARILSFGPLTYVGRISYGVYLFHWPVVWWVTASRLHVPALVAAVVQTALTFGLAALSFHLLEHPIRSGRFVFSRERLVIPAATVALIALGAAWLPAPDKARVVALSTSTEAVIPSTTRALGPTATQPPPPVRVMVVGDSFALSAGLGLEHWATEAGRIGVLNTGIVGCGFGRGGMNRGIGLERSWPPECEQREATLSQKLAEFQPDVVLLAGGMWDVTERKLEGQRTWTHIGDPDYDRYLLGEMQHLIDFLSAGGAKVAWATAPDFDPQYNPQTYMGKPPYYEAQPGRSERYNAVLAEAVASRPDTARLIDLAGWMKKWPGGEFDRSLRIDGVHFTEQSTDVAARWLGPELVKVARG